MKVRTQLIVAFLLLAAGDTEQLMAKGGR